MLREWCKEQWYQKYELQLLTRKIGMWEVPEGLRRDPEWTRGIYIMIAGVWGKRHGGAAAVVKGTGAGDCAVVVDAAGHIIGVNGGGHDDAVIRLNAAERHAVCDGGG